MLTTEFDYYLPEELIAQQSVEPRDHSKLMIVDRKNKKVSQDIFYNILNFLQSGDLLVWNNSKVFKARLIGRLMTSDGNNLWEHKRDLEIFLVKPMENEGVWQVLAKPGKHARIGTRVQFAEEFYCDVLVKEPSGVILVQFPGDEKWVREMANKYGRIPVPPYVKDEPHELEMYQTVYALKEGSVAAPTAGFHFTKNLIEQIKNKGVEFAEVTLHVGLGTFLPVKSEKVEDHTMHSEWVELDELNADKINKAKAEGRRIIAIGTTSVRTLEGIAALKLNGKNTVHSYHGEINIFIKPGFEFKIVDAMVTNFHLPKSTLLMLVSTFVGDTEFMLQCYKDAVENKYRFFSFGDAMFIK